MLFNTKIYFIAIFNTSSFQTNQTKDTLKISINTVAEINSSMCVVFTSAGGPNPAKQKTC